MPKRKPSFNTIYISERVQECLRPIARCALTTVVAPMGYGKTTAINWFLAEKTKGGKAVAIRMSIYSEKLPMLWRSAQDAFRFAGLDVLSAFDFPTGEAAATLVLEELCRAFSSGKTAYYLFLDDFHLLRDERAVRFICRISARLPENAHLIATGSCPRARLSAWAEICTRSAWSTCGSTTPSLPSMPTAAAQSFPSSSWRRFFGRARAGSRQSI